MKNYKEYLSESKKQYDFKIKIAGDVTNEQETALRQVLGKFLTADSAANLKKHKTPIQALPLDFPQVKNCEVHIYEVTLDYPTTPFELTEYISNELKINKGHLVVRRPGEPGEEYQTPQESREGALLDDPDYKEAGNAKFEDYYGDKYNTGFVKELNSLLKMQRAARNEVIPEAKSDDILREPGKTTNDFPQNNISPIKQAQDTRK
jgi:hypothetical protein